eukprot:TRINITY_DN1842_c0_g1_i1.p1 TRINITY_DN1842_c0_g1~~TRINITY_DN1842_c0_g1_i1.p1  ORF type:complete len:318 (-),score=92.65 TRINITY_DN1842_c0_g1_i1:56-1009(-)
MSGLKVAVALGGNALQASDKPATAEGQLEVVKETAAHLAELKASGVKLVVAHGNGPQVGRILLASEAAASVTPSMPFDVCGAMSQGYIGYHIQQALKFALKQKGIDVPVVSLVTQVVVSKDDKAFQNPSKPIGPFYKEEEAKKLATEKGFVMKEDAGRGYRRVVPSPTPVKIVELPAVSQLYNSDTIVITVGGGGIPVIEKEDGSLEGVAAVIDKDLATQRLAEDLDVDVLLILTEVEKVCVNFKKPDQRQLDHIDVAEAEKHMADNQFAPGSMLPKVQAAVAFARNKPGKRAIITSLFKAADALAGKTGTTITFTK